MVLNPPQYLLFRTLKHDVQRNAESLPAERPAERRRPVRQSAEARLHHVLQERSEFTGSQVRGAGDL